MAKKKKKKQKLKLPEGPICWDCAEEFGGISPNYPVTASLEKCKYCKKKKGCPSVGDFDWPKFGVGRVWD